MSQLIDDNSAFAEGAGDTVLGAGGRTPTAAPAVADPLAETDANADAGALPIAVPESASPLLPFAFARRFGAVILDRAPGATRAVVACRERPSLTTQAEIRRFAKCQLKLRLVSEEEFEELLTSTYSRDSSQARQMVEDLGDEMDLASLAQSVPETEDLLEQEDDAPIIRLINALLAEAIREGASDIHIETFERDLVVRFRVDGVMREIVRPKRELAPLLVSRIKVMGRMDIAEKRVPQDGRISLRIGGREVDVRVSTMPASNGERVVMRLLDKQAGRLKLNSLGMLETDLRVTRGIISKPHGIFLVTGPTGSGKTTTLYASLAELSTNTINILTVEDPIEYNLPGIGQTQVNNKADMTFARGLRAMLRQDPDVVMVGEIRDLETAEIAVQASLTGHMVMSTLHTNTAVGAVTRLADMGVEPFLLSSSLVGILAQRLVRQLCEDCKTPRRVTPSEARFLGDDTATVFEAAGCERCGHSGFRGRTGIYELVVIDEKMRQLIHDRASEQELAAYARTRTPGIRDDGKAKVLAGKTTVSEVLNVTLSD
ncbi:MAG: type II secretion system ATPase GspE [Pseudomonadota bacterium]